VPEKQLQDGIDPRDGEQLTLIPVGDIVKAISAARYSWANEKQLQDGIEQVLLGRFPFTREHRLSSADVIDFLVGTVGVEVKIKGSVTAVRAQLERYAEHACIDFLLLVTTRTQLRRLPDTVNGKPLRVLALTGSLF
jgi:hypothetical protein